MTADRTNVLTYAAPETKNNGIGRRAGLPAFGGKRASSKAKGMRLWLRPDYRKTKSVWVIRDGEKQISTGFPPEQKAAAEMALLQYVAAKRGANGYQKRGVPLLGARYYEARKRAEKAGRPFDLTPEFLSALLAAQDGKCALTGIPFEEPRGGRNNPFVLSLDRIDSTRGYTKDNVRLVVFAMNTALGPWGENVFHQIAMAYVERRASMVGREGIEPPTSSV